MSDRPQAGTGLSAGPGPRVLAALIIGQVGLHSAMAGLRLAAPLQTLREGYSAWSVGLLLALFAAAPVLMAMRAGRMIDRMGYHGPVRLAVALAVAGMALAVVSTFFGGWAHFAMLGGAAALTGSGANVGMLAIQRTAALSARSSAERVRIFSWLGVAPPLSNVIGPVAVGFVIDLAGFVWAYALLLVLPLATVWSARSVPRSAPPLRRDAPGHGPASELLRSPGMKRLLMVNWLLATAWDLHTFAIPILGHERHYSATTIGLILGCFTAAVTGIRLVLPLVAHRLPEVLVIRTAMLGSGLVLLAYTLTATPGQMIACALALGVTLGMAQPMIMSTLHRLTPDDRHGEALAFRSMAINGSSALMPLVFGAAGAVVGASVLFWVVGSVVGAGSWVARRLEGLGG